jgi:alkyl hydroperoxide reductase subunit F
MYDLVIIGGGPAGVSAGVYAGRKQLKTLFLTKDFGGQSIVSDDIQNWIGDISVSGQKLAERFENHVTAYSNDFVEVKKGEMVEKITKNEDFFGVETDKNKYETKTILLATGAHRRKLTVKGSEEFENKGITYCASCDGPLFANQDVVVVGGGNAGFETAAQLLAYAKSVTLLEHSAEYKADAITVEKVLAHPKMTGITNVSIKEIRGDKFVNSLIYTDTETNEEKTLSVTGVFVEIGLIPSTDFVANIVELDEYKRIKIDPWSQKTNTEGIWAAGDCTNIIYHQNNIASGDGVRALEDIYKTLHA